MTKEEAIKILEEEAEFLYGGDEPYNKIAFDMAIEALKQEPVRHIAPRPEDEWFYVAHVLKRSIQQVQRLHGEALQEVQRIIDKSDT